MKFILSFTLLLISFISFTKILSQPVARYGHTLTEIDGEVYLFGGKNIDGNTTLNDLWQWNSDNQEWNEKTPTGSLPLSRSEHSTAVSGASGENKMYVFCGVGDLWYNDVWSYSPSNNKWLQEPSTGDVPTTRRYHTSTTISDGKIFLFGGQAEGNEDKCYIYDPSSGVWEKKNAIFPGNKRSSHNAFLGNDGNPYIFGGEDEYGEAVNSMYRYSITLDNWEYISHNTAQKREEVITTGDWPGSRAGAAWAQDMANFFAVGGTDYYSNPQKELWKYTFASESWTKLDDLPHQHLNSAAAITKDSQGNSKGILLYGGEDGKSTYEVDLSPTYNLTTKISPTNATGCSVDASGTSSYDKDENVTLTAIDNPAQGWYFNEWTGDASGTGKITNITMNSDKTAIANFVYVTLGISSTKFHGVMCPDSSVLQHPYLMLPITFTASPDDGWKVTSIELTPAGTGNDATDLLRAYISKGDTILYQSLFPADNSSITATLNPSLVVPAGQSITINVFYEFNYPENYAMDEVKIFHLTTNTEDVTARPLTLPDGLKFGSAISDSLKICRVYNETGHGFAKIQNAINSSKTKNGDTCYVCAGTYPEEIVIPHSKSINLTSVKGKNHTFLNGNNLGSNSSIDILTIEGSNSSVSEFTFLTENKFAERGISVKWRADSVRIHNNIFKGEIKIGIESSGKKCNIFHNEFYKLYNFIALRGSRKGAVVFSNSFYGLGDYSLSVWGYGGHEIDRNTFYGNPNIAVFSDSNRISLNNFDLNSKSEIKITGSYNLVVGNTATKISIEGNLDRKTSCVFNKIESNSVNMISLKNCSTNNVEYNTIRNSKFEGIKVVSTSGASIKGNIISNSVKSGIYIQSSSFVFFEKNSIVSSGKNGIYIYNSNDSYIRKNDISSSIESGLFIYNSKDSQILNNKIVSGLKSGIFLYSSHSSSVAHNLLSKNCTGIIIYKTLNPIIVSNKIINSKCTNTGISVDNSDIELISNQISENNGNGIKFKNDSYAKMAFNNIIDNTGYGLDNSENSNQVTANNNYWGSTTPTENDFTGNVITDTWLSEATSLVLTSEIDTVLTTSAIDSFYVIANNLQSYEGSVDVTITDNLGWVTSPSESNHVFSDSTGVSIPVHFTVPENATENNRVYITAILNSDTSVSASVEIVLQSYKSILNSITILQDSLTITAPDSIQFSVSGYDQYNNGMDCNPIWSATSGTIDSSGFFRTVFEYGEVKIIAVDVATNIADTTILLILETEPILDYITIKPDTIKLKPNEVELFTASGYNANGFPHEIEPIWGATGGFIDEEGLYFADTLAGEFSVVVTDTLTGITAKALIIVDETTNAKTHRIPQQYSLNQNYPNPFNPSTTISYALPFESKVKVEIFNVLGQRIDIIANGVESAGLHSTLWDATHLASGIYVVRINATSIGSNSNFTKAIKMILLR